MPGRTLGRLGHAGASPRDHLAQQRRHRLVDVVAVLKTKTTNNNNNNNNVDVRE
jgi:hypothetical protein